MFKSGTIIKKRCYANRGYEIVTYEVDGSQFGGKNFIMQSAFNMSGDYIGSPRDANLLYKRYGITHWELNDPTNNVCSIGFSPTKRKWYGWSHRAISGFKVGYVVKKGDIVEQYIAAGTVAEDLNDCKNLAKFFAEDVS